MKKITTIGRILFALPFAIFGINHFLMMDYYMGMLTSFIPKTGYIMILTGIMLIIASISIITKKFVKLSTYIAGITSFPVYSNNSHPASDTWSRYNNHAYRAVKRHIPDGGITNDSRYVYGRGETRKETKDLNRTSERSLF